MMNWYMNAEAHNADYEELIALERALAEEEDDDEIPALRGMSEEDLADAAAWALTQEEPWFEDREWEWDEG